MQKALKFCPSVFQSLKFKNYQFIERLDLEIFKLMVPLLSMPILKALKFWTSGLKFNNYLSIKTKVAVITISISNFNVQANQRTFTAIKQNCRPPTERRIERLRRRGYWRTRLIRLQTACPSTPAPFLWRRKVRELLRPKTTSAAAASTPPLRRNGTAITRPTVLGPAPSWSMSGVGRSMTVILPTYEVRFQPY